MIKKLNFDVFFVRMIQQKNLSQLLSHKNELTIWLPQCPPTTTHMSLVSSGVGC